MVTSFVCYTLWDFILCRLVEGLSPTVLLLPGPFHITHGDFLGFVLSFHYTKFSCHRQHTSCLASLRFPLPFWITCLRWHQDLTLFWRNRSPLPLFVIFYGPSSSLSIQGLVRPGTRAVGPVSPCRGVRVPESKDTWQYCVTDWVPTSFRDDWPTDLRRERLETDEDSEKRRGEGRWWKRTSIPVLIQSNQDKRKVEWKHKNEHKRSYMEKGLKRTDSFTRIGGTVTVWWWPCVGDRGRRTVE